MEASSHVSTSLPEEDALASLEDRILRAAELVATLRSERDAAVLELESIRRATASTGAENQKLRQELEALRGERKQVRIRIEKLLGQMELL